MSAEPNLFANVDLEAGLRLAVDRFNEAFNYQVRLPMHSSMVLRMAEVADLRGRRDLGLALRIGLRESQAATPLAN
jgi:hypothetical protein